MRNLKAWAVFAFALAIILTSGEIFGKTNNPPLEPPPSSMAMVVFYRPNASTAKLVDYYVYHQEKPIGMLKDGTYFTFVVTPGSQTFVFKSPSTSEISIDLEAGKTYFVHVKAKGMAFPPKAALTLVDEATGRKQYAKCKYRVYSL